MNLFKESCRGVYFGLVYLVFIIGFRSKGLTFSFCYITAYKYYKWTVNTICKIQNSDTKSRPCLLKVLLLFINTITKQNTWDGNLPELLIKKLSLIKSQYSKSNRQSFYLRYLITFHIIILVLFWFLTGIISTNHLVVFI